MDQRSFDDWALMRPKSAWADCPECGATYYKPDTGDRCYQCEVLHSLHKSIKIALKEREDRREKHGWKPPTPHEG